MITHGNIVAKIRCQIPALADALHKVMEKQPNTPAVLQDDHVKSYQQLIESAQDIATQLLEAGIMPGHRLAIDLPRSIALYELMLGCLIAEVSFMSLPRGLDRSQQPEMAKKANCVGILSDLALFPKDGLEIRGIGHFCRLVKSSSSPTKADTTSTEIYCVRTSGTSGEPKIVPITNSQLSAFLNNAQTVLGISDYATWLWMHDLSFDLSIAETLGCLVHCGCLVVLDEDAKRNYNTIFDLMIQKEVKIVTLTPSEFRYIFSHSGIQNNFDNLCVTDIIFCGEKLSSKTLLPIYRDLDRIGVRLINTYGPSEATVFCTSHTITEQDLDLDSIPIGRPFPDMVLDLVDQDAAGAGELTLHGPQVFNGYDGAQPLTERYYTKDICLLDAQNRFVYVGRTGGYHKVNGFRVEPLEIEQFLESLPNVDEAIVWVESADDQSFLLAYIRVRRNKIVTSRTLRVACSTLPPYLRPARYVLLKDEEWPINDRGKSDRLSLRRIACGQN